MLSFVRSAQEKPDEDLTPGRRQPTLGLALGAGAARGWCHIGVLRELADHGITPHVIAGTSIGAVVGGCYAAGRLDDLESFARALTRRRVFGLLDLTLSGRGLISGGRLRARLEAAVGDRRVEDLPIRFAAVATATGSGHEVWLTQGDLGEAIRASYALPGILEPVLVGGRWLVDGALVNPVPVTLCRALGADMVVAVNIFGDTLFRGTVMMQPDAPEVIEAAAESAGVRGARRAALCRRTKEGAPSMATVMTDAFNTMQDRISRSRLAGDPPDVMVKARLDGMGLFDFHRADELIALGRDAARRAIPEIVDHLAATPAVIQPAR